jgi:hypothetical protein
MHYKSRYQGERGMLVFVRAAAVKGYHSRGEVSEAGRTLVARGPSSHYLTALPSLTLQ